MLLSLQSTSDFTGPGGYPHGCVWTSRCPASCKVWVVTNAEVLQIHTVLWSDFSDSQFTSQWFWVFFKSMVLGLRLSPLSLASIHVTLYLSWKDMVVETVMRTLLMLCCSKGKGGT